MKHVLLFLWLFPGFCMAQLVSDVRLRMPDPTRLEIWYNLLEPADSVWIEVEARFGGQLKPTAAYLYGDYGRDVPVGPNRRIVWYLYDEGHRIKSDVQVRVLARPLALPGPIVQEAPEAIALYPLLNDKSRWPIGPGWAALSAVLPGVGNMFVHRGETGKPKVRVGARPLVTASFYGALLYGLNQRRLARAWYDEYTRQKNPTEGEPFYQTANTYHQRYYLATRVAALIWATDVTLTLIRGLRDQRAVRKASTVSWAPGWQNGVLIAQVRARF